jgi:gluconolactonase
MKRILPVLCVLSLGVAAFACKAKSSTSDNNGGGASDNGSATDPGANGGAPSGTDPNSTVTQEDLTTNPSAGLQPPTAILETDQYSDGAVWHAALGALYFTTPLGEGALFRMLPDGSVIKIRDGSKAQGTTPIANAIFNGDVFTTEAKQLVRASVDGGAPSVVATSWSTAGSPPPPGVDGGTPASGAFDTLKDIAARKDGTLYVTDPGYFAAPIANRIYRITNGKVQVIESFDDVPRPTGITLSPDQKALYIGFTAPEQGTMPFVRKYFVNDDGSVGEWKKFIDLGADSAADGLTVDKVGNLYIAAKDGIEVYKPDGTKWGVIALPEKPTSMAFGAKDLKTMFITTEGSHIFTIAAKLAGVVQQ